MLAKVALSLALSLVFPTVTAAAQPVGFLGVSFKKCPS